MDAHRFFGHEIDPLTLGGKSIALLLSVLLSGLIGLERQIRGQPAGLRTHILVSVGSTLITITSIEFGLGGTAGSGDAARLAAQIVSGVGFLGAGAIIRDGANVHGLTTAASIWTAAAIGIAVGAGPRSGEVAVVAALIVLATLVVLNWLETACRLKQNFHVLLIEVREAEQGPARLLALLSEHGVLVQGVASQGGAASTQDPTRKMTIRIRLPRQLDRTKFVALLTGVASLVSFDLE